MTVNVEICNDGMGIYYFDDQYNRMVEYYSYPFGFAQRAYKMAKKLETEKYQVADYSNLPLSKIKEIDSVNVK